MEIMEIPSSLGWNKSTQLRNKLILRLLFITIIMKVFKCKEMTLLNLLWPQELILMYMNTMHIYYML